MSRPLSRTYTLDTTDYTYLMGNRLSTAGTTTYNYDLNGNLSAKVQGGTTTNYTFDSQDRLTNVSSPSLNMQYQYDGLWNRVSKTVSGTTTKFLVDPNGFLPQVIAEMDNGGNIISYYVYDGMGLVAKMTSQSIYFYHYDGLGSTIAMTDSNGNMVNKYAYDEFGNLVNSVEATSNPFLYVGQFGVMDEDNGLLYMRARYYDQEVGRFISKDPIGFLGGLNLYAFVANNPIKFIDPMGLICIYSQSSGWAVCTNDVTNQIYLTGKGYSGRAGAARNNPDSQFWKDFGVIPRGDWIVGPSENRPNSTGPVTLPLFPLLFNDVWFTGRDFFDFVIHGDNIYNDASQGCVVMDLKFRRSIPPGELFRVVP